MPAFGINLGTIAQQGVESYRSGYDRAKELAAKERQAQMDREKLRAQGLANDVTQSEAADRLAAIKLQNAGKEQDIDIRNKKSPYEIDALELQNRQRQQAIDIQQEQRDPRLQALQEEVRHAKVSNPLSEQAMRIDNKGRVLDNEGKVLANSMAEFRNLAMGRTDQIESAIQTDKVRTAVNDAKRGTQVSDAKLDNVGDEIALNNAVMEQGISEAEAGQAKANTARTTSQYEGLEAAAKLSVTKDLRAELQDTARADVLTKKMAAQNGVFMGRLQELQNSEGKITEAMQEEQYKRMGSVVLAVRELNDGTEAGKQRAVNAIRESPLFQNPDIVDIEFTDDGKFRAIGKDGKTFVDKNGFDDDGNPDKLEFDMNLFNEDLLPYAFQDSEVEKKLEASGKGSSVNKLDPVKQADALNKYEGDVWERIQEKQGNLYGAKFDEESDTWKMSPAQYAESQEIASRAATLMRGGRMSISQAMNVAGKFGKEYAELEEYGQTKAKVDQEYKRQVKLAEKRGTGAPSRYAIMQATLAKERAEYEASEAAKQEAEAAEAAQHFTE